jgi:hypothetical protein
MQQMRDAGMVSLAQDMEAMLCGFNSTFGGGGSTGSTSPGTGATAPAVEDIPLSDYFPNLTNVEAWELLRSLGYTDSEPDEEQ